MRLPALLTSDLHVTASSSTEYRWGLFPWLGETARKHRAKTVIICGDLTDAKDNHSAELVNRVVAAVKGLREHVDEVKILAGNHDWLRRGHEFFRFLSVIDGVEFVTAPREDQDTQGVPAMYLPYSKDPVADWAGFDLSHYRFVFMHQTVGGAVSSNGQKLDGETMPDIFGGAGKVYSGDIHVPQVCGLVEYIGSPYHVHFGDRFEPRVILLDRQGKPSDLHFPTINRFAAKVSGLRELRRLKLRPGDQVKVEVSLGAEEKHDWSRVKREAVAWLREQGAEVHGIKLRVPKAQELAALSASAARRLPADDVLRFVEHECLGGDALEAALNILERK